MQDMVTVSAQHAVKVRCHSKLALLSRELLTLPWVVVQIEKLYSCKVSMRVMSLPTKGLVKR